MKIIVFIFGLMLSANAFADNCYRSGCAVWIKISKASQTAELYVDGQHQDTWKVSTGKKGRGTPNYDKHPNGRVYDKYTSTKWPGGDWKGLGNMPYAVFISGGIAIHGTPKKYWKMLGRTASRGCIRLHPDNGFRFNRLVRKVGIKNTWITVH